MVLDYSVDGNTFVPGRLRVATNCSSGATATATTTAFDPAMNPAPPDFTLRLHAFTFPRFARAIRTPAEIAVTAC
jgi:hypothetical protein